MDLHPTAGVLAIYILGLIFYRRGTSDIHSWTHILQ